MSKTTQVQDPRLRVSRRGFLKASGAGAALATGGAIGAIPFRASRAAAQSGWDAEHDVVVVGSGGAAFAAAISARHLGADVLMLEKGAYAGGTTLVSGGTMWIPNNTPMREAGVVDDREDALRYMARYSFPAHYDADDERLGLTEHDYAMLSAFYDLGTEAMDTIQEAGASTWRMAINGFTGDIQADYMDHLPENKAPQGRSIVPQDPDGNPGGGGLLIQNYQDHAERVGIPLMLNHRVERVILKRRRRGHRRRGVGQRSRHRDVYPGSEHRRAGAPGRRDARAERHPGAADGAGHLDPGAQGRHLRLGRVRPQRRSDAATSSPPRTTVAARR